jgi:hypothetical protein
VVVCGSGKFRIKSINLPTYMLSMTPHTRSGRFSKSNGPGWIPYSMKAPSSTAVVPDPGMPSVRSGTSAPVVDELLAASGPATPSIAPWPKCSGYFESRFSIT